ncbi:MAG: rRNA pseudouridine synthase [Acidobacteria bacterium]|nr:rRNA pseudouridine synthase [Acidobacteriota bacterium]
MAQERLQKIVAAAGIASRRKAEALITGGRVTVNGQPVTQLGAKADPIRDRITVNGHALRKSTERLYYMLNKPKGYVSTTSDPEGRRTVLDLVHPLLTSGARLYPIGRLDFHSEGLLLLTNDGEFAQAMTHASHHVPRTYLVKVSGRPAPDALDRLRSGISIADQPSRNAPRGRARTRIVRTAPARIELVRDAPNPWFEVSLIEGRNRQIRRMFERIGHFVEKIKRVRFGTLALDIEPGRFRPLTRAEVRTLRAMAT